jgi:lipoprotein-anchoring transpeptidase ErfK/SrfK
MTDGRHVQRRSARAALFISAVAGVVILTAGGAFAAFRYDHARAQQILPGVTVAGVSVGGMTREQAIDAVERATGRRLASTNITIHAGGRSWTQTPAALGREAGVASAVDRALGVNNSMGVLSRVWHRVRSEPVGVSIDVTFSGAAGVGAFVGKVADAVRIQAVDAAMTERDGKVVFVKSRPGRVLDKKAAARLLRRALQTDETSVTLPTESVRASVTEKRLGPTIVVHLDQNRLDLYRGFSVQETFPVATAKPGFTTPVGDWTVDAKAVDPVWHNPALDSWGAGEPAVVPGGPGNPMGPRALYLSAPGLIRIHGTNDESSIGHYASHGCIRMHNADVLRLYPLVPVGTHVLIVGARPY